MNSIRLGPDRGAGFLGANTWGNSALTKLASLVQAPFITATSVPAPTTAPVASATTSAWGSGMLGNMAGTTTGVIAGGFLFQGIEHLLDRQGSNSGSMNGLSNELSADRHEVADISKTEDVRPDSASVFDTSSVDDFIASDTDGIG